MADGTKIYNTIEFEAFTFPTTIGTDGQVMKVPLSGSVLEWGDADDSEITSGKTFIYTAHTNTEEKLRIGVSNDGTNARFLTTTGMYTPPAGSVRDPSFLAYNDRYYVCYTKNAYSDGNDFGIAVSDDLQNWSLLTNVTLTGNIRVWGPDWFVDTDGTVRIYVTCSTDGTEFDLYEIHATTTTLDTWSSPVLVEKTGGGALDVATEFFMTKVGSTYYLFYKEGGGINMVYATSSNHVTGFTKQKTGNWSNIPQNAEGPCLIDMGNDVWRIYVDCYTLTPQVTKWCESSDGFQTWSSPTTVVADQQFAHAHFSLVSSQRTVRHLTVIDTVQLSRFITNLIVGGNYGTGVNQNCLNVAKTGVASSEAGADFFSTLSSDANTLYNVGRIYGKFRADNFQGASLNIAYPTGYGTFTDVITVRNGCVGIGTTNPTSPLTMGGNIDATNCNIYGANLFIDSLSDNGSGKITVYDDLDATGCDITCDTLNYTTLNPPIAGGGVWTDTADVIAPTDAGKDVGIEAGQKFYLDL